MNAGPFMRLLLRRRGLVLVAALLLMALAGVVGRGAGDKLAGGAYLDPSAESQRAWELLTRDFPGGPPNLVLVAESITGDVDSAAAVRAGRELTERLAGTTGGGVQSYWATPDPSLRASDGPVRADRGCGRNRPRWAMHALDGGAYICRRYGGWVALRLPGGHRSE